MLLKIANIKTDILEQKFPFLQAYWKNKNISIDYLPSDSMSKGSFVVYFFIGETLPQALSKKFCITTTAAPKSFEESFVETLQLLEILYSMFSVDEDYIKIPVTLEDVIACKNPNTYEWHLKRFICFDTQFFWETLNKPKIVSDINELLEIKSMYIS